METTTRSGTKVTLTPGSERPGTPVVFASWQADGGITQATCKRYGTSPRYGVEGAIGTAVVGGASVPVCVGITRGEWDTAWTEAERMAAVAAGREPGNLTDSV